MTVATTSPQDASLIDPPPVRTSPLRDTGLVFSRAMRLSLRNPVWTVMGIAQPLLYLFLFGPLLTNVARAPGFPAGDAWQVFVPALMVMLGLFGSAFVGFGLIQEWRDGVIERMRVTPMSRFSLLSGRVLRDGVVLTVQAVLLVLAGMTMGLRAPLGGVILGIAIVAVIGMTMSAASYAIALTLKSEDALAPLANGILVPMLLLSGIMLPITRDFAPDWLYWLSRVNPMAYIVDSARAAFLGNYTGSEFWVGIGVAAVLAVGVTALSTRSFTRQSS